jgi:hypothetical protein
MSAAENTGVYLLNLAIVEGAQNRMQFCQSQGLLHVRFKDSDGEVAVQVCGKNLDEVGSQLVLESLKKISIQKLRTAQNEPQKTGGTC